MKLGITKDRERELDDAKARLHQAARSVDPLSPLRKHPFTTVAVAGMSGFLFGSKEHPAVMKTLRLSASVGKLLRPVLLIAGRFVAGRMAHHAGQGGVDPALAEEQPS